MIGGNPKIKLQERVIDLTYHWGRPLSRLPVSEFENQLYAELSSLEKQDSSYESGRGLETVPHLLEVGMLVDFYLANSDFLAHEYFSKNYSRNDWHRMILLGAYLHDVGKNHLDSAVLGKRGVLDEQQLTEIKTHVDSSKSQLKNLGFEEPVYNIAFYHHERIDGSGYPEGLSEEQIPREVLPVSFFDTLHAVSTRKYFGNHIFMPETAEEAVNYAANHLSKRFSPEIAEFARNSADLQYLLGLMMKRARNSGKEQPYLTEAMSLGFPVSGANSR